MRFLLAALVLAFMSTFAQPAATHAQEKLILIPGSPQWHEAKAKYEVAKKLHEQMILDVLKIEGDLSIPPDDHQAKVRVAWQKVFDHREHYQLWDALYADPCKAGTMDDVVKTELLGMYDRMSEQAKTANPNSPYGHPSSATYFGESVSGRMIGCLLNSKKLTRDEANVIIDGVTAYWDANNAWDRAHGYEPSPWARVNIAYYEGLADGIYGPRSRKAA